MQAREPHPQFCSLVTRFTVRFSVLDTEEDLKGFDSLFPICSPCRIEGNFDKDECELILVTEL